MPKLIANLAIVLMAASLGPVLLMQTALGQTANQPVDMAASDPRFTAAKNAFEALPEAERRAIQFDLVWAGDFTGANSGGFGPLTFRAINAFKSKSGAVTDGILSVADRKALAAAARVARDKVGFQSVADARTGARIGIPQAVLPKRDVTPSGGSRWQSADGRITLDTRTGQKGDTLQALFDKATTGTTPGRKVTYKLLRPDFYVVSGETASGKFYSRMASGPDGLRGFSVGHDKALADSFDPLVIAIANSFEPYPGAVLAGVAPVQTQAPALAGPALAGSAAALAALAAAQPVRPKERLGVGLIVAPGLVLTARANIADCKALKAGTREARLRSSGGDGSGLVLLDVAGQAMSAPPSLAQAFPMPDAPLVVMAFGETGGPARNAVALPGQVANGAGLAISAPLQPGGAGAVAYDRQGHIVGIALANPAERYLVAGVVPQRSHALAGRGQIESALKGAGITLAAAGEVPPMSTGAVAALAKPQIITLACTL
jgi:hypothetical protein